MYLRRIFALVAQFKCDVNLVKILEDLCFSFRVCKTLFFPQTICETSWIIFTELPRRAKLLLPKGLFISHFGVQGNERKNASAKLMYEFVVF